MSSASSVNDQLEKPVEAPTPRKRNPFKGKSGAFWVAFFMLILTALISAIDAVIIAAALPAITLELNGTSNQAFWSGTAFLLASVVVQPLFGTFSEIFGRRNNLIAAQLWFLVGSILCARSSSMEMLIGSRVIQGIGGGGMIALVEVTVTDMVGLNERGAFGGLVALAWATGTVVGPIMGGAIAKNTTWRWIFYINIPIVVIVVIGITMFLTLRSEQQSFKDRLKRVDYLGVFVFVGSTTSFLFGLTAGGVMYPWASANVLVPLIIGIFGFAGFWAIEEYVAKEPMMPFRTFYSVTAAVGYFGTWIHGMILWGIIYYLILYFQATLVHDTLEAGIDALPITLSSAPSAAIAGIVMTLMLRFRPTVWLGWIITTVSAGLFTLFDYNSNLGERIGFLILMGIGTGILFPALQFCAQAGQPDDDVAMATSNFVFMRSLGQTFGVALGGVIFQNSWDTQMANKVAENLVPSQYQYNGHFAEVLVLLLPSIPDNVRVVLQQIYAASLRNVWYFFIPLAGLGFVSSLFMKDLSLDKVLNSKQQFEDRRKQPTSQV